MSSFKHYHAGEPVSWKAYDRSNYRYESDSYGSPIYHSNAVVLHVPMCCEDCVQRVRKSLQNVHDVNSVDVDVRRQKVIVRGEVDPDRVLRKVQKQIVTATFWDSSDYEAANYSASSAYAYPDEYSFPTVSLCNYKYYGRRPSDDYENYNAEAYDYRQPTLIIGDYDYYNRSPAYEYRDTYPSSPKYSRHNNYTYSYPSHVEYPRHNDYHAYRSYDAHRYRR